MRVILAALLLAAALAVSAAGLPPSLNTPGGLTVEQTPQFVLLTHDDGVDKEARTHMMKLIKGRKSANGCQVNPTMFTLMDPDGWTVCEDIVKLYDEGFEIADHTIHHETLSKTNKTYVEDEIMGAKRKLEECGIPGEDVVGFRPPYLNTDLTVREVLHDNGFLYESAIIEDWKWSVSKGFGDRVWPWDMRYGNPVNCSLADLVQETTQICDKNESWPGLWQVPVWRLSNQTAGNQPYAMDPGFSYECNNGEGCNNDNFTIFEILKANFDETYAGNKAPFGVFIHIYWLKEQDNQEQLQEFIDYTLEKDDVYYVTMRQLLAWMQNPVPKDQLTPEILGCGNPGGAPGSSSSSNRRR